MVNKIIEARPIISSRIEQFLMGRKNVLMNSLEMSPEQKRMEWKNLVDHLKTSIGSLFSNLAVLKKRGYGEVTDFEEKSLQEYVNQHRGAADQTVYVPLSAYLEIIQTRIQRNVSEHKTHLNQLFNTDISDIVGLFTLDLDSDEPEQITAQIESETSSADEEAALEKLLADDEVALNEIAAAIQFAQEVEEILTDNNIFALEFLAKSETPNASEPAQPAFSSQQAEASTARTSEAEAAAAPKLWALTTVREIFNVPVSMNYLYMLKSSDMQEGVHYINIKSPRYLEGYDVQESTVPRTEKRGSAPKVFLTEQGLQFLVERGYVSIEEDEESEGIEDQNKSHNVESEEQATQAPASSQEDAQEEGKSETPSQQESKRERKRSPESIQLNHAVALALIEIEPGSVYGFKYRTVRQIRQDLLAQFSPEVTQNISAVIADLKNYLIHRISEPNLQVSRENTQVKEVIDQILNSGKILAWEPIYNYISDHFGEMRVSDFVESVLNRFNPEKLEKKISLQALADQISDHKIQAFVSLVRASSDLRLGSDYVMAQNDFLISAQLKAILDTWLNSLPIDEEFDQLSYQNLAELFRTAKESVSLSSQFKNEHDLFGNGNFYLASLLRTSLRGQGDFNWYKEQLEIQSSRGNTDLNITGLNLLESCEIQFKDGTQMYLTELVAPLLDQSYQSRDLKEWMNENIERSANSKLHDGGFTSEKARQQFRPLENFFRYLDKMLEMGPKFLSEEKKLDSFLAHAESTQELFAFKFLLTLVSEFVKHESSIEKTNYNKTKSELQNLISALSDLLRHKNAQRK